MNRFFNVVIIVFLSSLIIHSQPDVKSTIEYYDIYGSNINDLKLEIQKKGSKEGSKRYDAYTTWRVGWEFETISSNNKCTLKNVIVITEIKIVMPKWVNYSSAKKEVRQIWDKYYKALLDHENGHKEIGLKAADEIEKEIKKIKPKSSCDELERDINRNGDYVIAKYNSVEKEYDRKTNHGLNTGVILK